MLNLIFGLEDSFTKSFFYVLFLASALTIYGSIVYLVMVGLPMIANRSAYAAQKQAEMQTETFDA